MQSAQTAISTFQLPPPLNAYIYPSPLYAFRTSKDGSVDALTIREFETICETLGTLALQPQETAAVYDVPAVPLTFEGDDEGNDDDEYEDDDIDDENESDDALEDLDEDEDWVIDDDDIGTAA